MKGIRQRGNTVEVYFSFNGKQQFIKVNDLNQAIRIRDTIYYHLVNNTLTQEVINSVVNPITILDVLPKYLKTLQTNKQTKHTYENILEHHWIKELSEIALSDITSEMLLDILYDKNLSDKYINQILIPLRGLFDTAIMFKYLEVNPTALLKNRKLQSKLPDPFSKEETQVILNYLQTNEHEVYFLFYLLSFFTGLRPSEALALSWNDIDDTAITVHKNRLNGIEKPVTKTKTIRRVLLNDKSKQAIEGLYELNKLASHIFINPETNQPFFNNKPARLRFNKAMLVNNIRYRPSYNTRHSYATRLLMSGINPVFVANQLGHSVVILMNTYARWINSEKDLEELSKLDL